MERFVRGLYPWPFDGSLSVVNTALVVIDMQTDFCAEGGWLDGTGVDLAPLRKPIPKLQMVLASARKASYPIIYTREGHRPDLTDLNANKHWRSVQNGAEIGAEGPLGRYLVRGEANWDIIPELAPMPSETIVDKPGKSAFFATDFEQLLRKANIRNLILTGVTTDCCVQSTLRDANDRGFECLLLEDCCAAVLQTEHEAQVEIFRLVGGHYGSIATSGDLIDAIG
ncbi:MAG: isochorismatase family cysteine hydrolase [Paracoccaceae bacterium]